MALSVPALTAQMAGAPVVRGEGALDGGLQNYNIYRTKDGRFLAVGALESHFWVKFLKHIGMEHLIITSGSTSGPLSGQAVTQEVVDLFQSKTFAEWTSIAQECDACVEPVLTIQEMEQHSQHIARNVFLRYDQPTRSPSTGAIPAQIRLGPCLSSHTPHRLPRAGQLGEHTDNVMQSAGFTDIEIKNLRLDRVIG